MTDAQIAREMRTLAADRGNPLSVTCVVCKSTAGDACVATATSKLEDTGFHRLRMQDARLTADGYASRLLVTLSKETP